MSGTELGLYRRKLAIEPLEKRLMLDASMPVIAGQVLWLDSSDASSIYDSDGDNAQTGTGGSNDGFAGTVATWADKSGNNYDVTALTGEQPVYGSALLNGYKILSFDGINDRLTNLTTSLTGTDMTMYVIFRRTSNTGREALLDLGSNPDRNAIFINEGGTDKYNYYLNGSFYNTTTTYFYTTYKMVSMTQSGTSLNMWVDGASGLSATTATRTATTGITIGDDSTSGDWLQGDIAEVLIYDHSLTSDERHDMENYLAKKWGLGMSNTVPALAANPAFAVDEGDFGTIHITYSDVDNTDSELLYTITNAVDYGYLYNTNTGLTIGLNDTFTQNDLDLGYIEYHHDGSDTLADSFQYTVNDRYASDNGTKNITINPLNDPPSFYDSVVVSSENFESGATGWSDNTTTSGGSILTTYLGRHSQEAGAQNTFKTYALSGTENYVTIGFDFYEIDSWDGETFRLYINDSAVFINNFQQGTYDMPLDGSSGSVSYTIQQTTPFNANFVHGSWNDQTYHFELRIQTTASTIKLGFSSTLDQGVTDEAWGVDNIVVSELRGSGTPGPFNVSEISTNGEAFGQVIAHDGDIGDTITYSIIGGSGASMFAINPTTGVLTVINAAALDYETIPSYTLTILATDSGVPTLTASTTVTVNVLNAPENTAPVITSTNTAAINENVAVGTLVKTVTSTDAESNTVTYSITAGNSAGMFAINSATGAITTLRIPNFEGTSSYTLTVQATDNGFGVLSSTQNLTITINNLNEAPEYDAVQAVLNSDPMIRYNATTGNFYKYIPTTATFAGATTAASAATVFGIAGHLATITSASENTFVAGLISGTAWLGATDSATEGNWLWQGGGAEAGQMFWQGNASGSAQGGYYTNWNTSQPDDGGGNEDGMQMIVGGKWNDVSTASSLGYVIEWEGASVIAALPPTSLSVAENSANGTVLGTISAYDPDTGEVLTYSVTGGTGLGIFSYNAANGQVTLTNTAVVNYEATTSYTLNLQVVDSGSLTDTMTLTINITDVNEAPTDISLTNQTINENSAIGTVVGTLSTVDPDPANTHTYTLLSNPYNKFSIVGNQLRVNGNLDFESTSSITVQIRTNDGNGGTYSENFTITINDVAESPTFDQSQGVLIQMHDPTLYYSAATGNFYRLVTTSTNYATAKVNADAATLLGVNGHLATITSAAENAFLTSLITASTYIGASDAVTEGSWLWDDGPENGQLFWLGTSTGSAQNGFYTNWNGGEPNNSGNEDAIQLLTTGRWNDINAGTSLNYLIEWEGNAVRASLNPLTFSIAELSPNGTSLGSTKAYDPDAGDTLSYSVTGGTGAGIFAVNTTTGEITLTNTAAVNYELTNSYTLDVLATDSTGRTATTTLTINVMDANDTPTLVSLSSATIPENSATGTVVGLLSTADEDVADTHTYSLVSNPGGYFTIVGNELRVASNINFEVTPSITLQIRTDDGNGGTHDETLVITVTDVNDTPTLVSISNSVIQENSAAGTVVGLLSTTDEDTADTHTYSLISNPGGYFTIVGNELRVLTPFSYETAPSVTLQIRTDDGHGGTYDETITITVTDRNDVPTLISLSNATIAENSANGTVIGLLSTTDEDVADAHTYSLISNPGGRFTIVGNELRVASNINFEATPTLTIQVRTDDGHGGTHDETFVITVTDANDTPTNITMDNRDVDENVAVGTLIGTLSSVDEDPADTHTYTLLTNPGNKFAIVGDQIVTNGSIDYEEHQHYTLRILTDDGNGGTFARNLVINIGDVMDTYVPPNTPTPPTPPASSGGSGEALGDVKGNLIEETLNRGEAGQQSAFYGLGDFIQILRDGVSSKLRGLLGNSPFAQNNDGQEIRNDILEPIGQAGAQDTGQELDESGNNFNRHYTNMRSVLEALNRLPSERTVSGHDKDASQQKDENHEFFLKGQDAFVDVMAYHEKKLEHLRKALMQ